MPAGDLAVRHDELVRTETGVLVKLVPTCGPVDTADVFTVRQLHALDDAIADAEYATGLRFAVYVGDLGADTRARAEELVDSLGADAPYTVLVAISPGQRVVEVVTGAEAALRVSERGARAAVLAVAASCGDGDLLGGLLDGIRILTDHAGSVPERRAW